jgi:hypothetical protein
LIARGERCCSLRIDKAVPIKRKGKLTDQENLVPQGGCIDRQWSSGLLVMQPAESLRDLAMGISEPAVERRLSSASRAGFASLRFGIG